MFNFEKAFKLTKPFFKAVGQNALKKHKAQIFDDGLNQDGKPFAEYSTSYKAFRRRKGKTTKPNLTLSGKLKNSFRYVKAFDDGFEYGINNKDMAKRYEYQNVDKARRKDGKFARRFVSTKKQPMTPEVQEMIMEQTQKQLARQIAKEVRSKGFGVIIYKN